MKRKVRKKIKFYLHRFVDVHMLATFFRALHVWLMLMCFYGYCRCCCLWRRRHYHHHHRYRYQYCCCCCSSNCSCCHQNYQRKWDKTASLLHRTFYIVYADLSYQLDQLTWFIWSHTSSIDKLHKCLSTCIQRTMYFKSDGKINDSLKTHRALVPFYCCCCCFFHSFSSFFF